MCTYVCVCIYIYIYIYTNTQTAAYLGSRVQHNRDHKCEIKARLNAAWLTVMKLDLFWRKAAVTLKWKLRVLDAVIHSKVLNGMETPVISQSDYDKIDAFQVIIFRQSSTLSIPFGHTSQTTQSRTLLTTEHRTLTKLLTSLHYHSNSNKQILNSMDIPLEAIQIQIKCELCP